MSGCVRNIRAKNYQNLIIGFQVTAKNVGDVFFGTQCTTTTTVAAAAGTTMHSVQTCLIRG